MPGGFDGAGNYVRYYNWTQDAANSIPILASRFDTEHNGFAAALSNCLTRDGQGKPTATIDWNAQRLTGLANANALTDAVSQQYGDARYARSSLRKMKSSATSRASTIVEVDDPDLVIAIPAAGNYLIDLSLLFDGNGLGTQGIRYTLNYSGTTAANCKWSGALYVGAALLPSPNLLFAQATSVTIASNADNNFRGQAFLLASGPGNLSVQWAQKVSNATATIMQAGSWLKAELVA